MARIGEVARPATDGPSGRPRLTVGGIAPEDSIGTIDDKSAEVAAFVRHHGYTFEAACELVFLDPAKFREPNGHAVEWVPTPEQIEQEALRLRGHWAADDATDDGPEADRPAETVLPDPGKPSSHQLPHADESPTLAPQSDVFAGESDSAAPCDRGRGGDPEPVDRDHPHPAGPIRYDQVIPSFSGETEPMPEQIQRPNDLLTFTEAGEVVAVSRTTIGAWVDGGYLPAVPMPGSRRRRIRRSTLLAFIDQLETAGVSAPA